MLATDTDRELAFLQCVADRTYFIDTFVQIKAKGDDTEDEHAPAAWLPFHLWPAQRAVIAAVDQGDHLVIPKARQLGQTWLILACILWQLLFRPACTALLFSKREKEAWELLKRLTGMFAHLPPWLQSVAGGVTEDSNSVWRLGNGSEALAFPTTGGDSYTAQIALCDEFDLVDNQDSLLEAVTPTVIESGQLILLSRVDKDKPLSAFKRMYQAAHTGLGRWRAIFLGWQDRPGRTATWYAARVAESLAKDGTLDAVQAQYPATEAEALAQKSGNKRLPAAWLLACYTRRAPLLLTAPAPAIPALTVYTRPVAGTVYVIGADPAEGNPTSDDSAAVVVDRPTGQEVATLVGKLQPAEFAGYLAQVAAYYHGASVLVERNNHGHAVLLALRGAVAVMPGTDTKPGWLTTGPSKALLYDHAAVCLQAGDAGIAALETYTQLTTIEGATLSAPDGQHDDRAVAWALAQLARARVRREMKAA